MTTKISLYPRDVIDANPEVVARILKAIGHPEALVTDKTYLSDFTRQWDVEGEERILKAVNEEFGLSLMSTLTSFPDLIALINKRYLPR